MLNTNLCILGMLCFYMNAFRMINSKVFFIKISEIKDLLSLSLLNCKSNKKLCVALWIIIKTAKKKKCSRLELTFFA